MVTTKGTGLNPNAKVWQEIPAQQSGIQEVTDDSPWLQSYPPSAEMAESYSTVASLGSKGYNTEYLDSTADYTPVPTATMDLSDMGYLVFDPQGDSATDFEVSKLEPMSEEGLHESLKKQLEFCLSRENLSQDLYLMSQMDSDQFVPISTIASMEDIKALTDDINLILDILRASPLVQVDEAGEKVRPNHSRCIIILREVPDTTPVEEVEALFRSENCPKLLRAEFAHNDSWYITFQSDMDALQAYRYLREEVKMFQGKPIMARIKAINTFFAKNGFCIMDSGAYQQQHTQPQTPCDSPVYMPQVYSPQQPFPVYPVVSPSWSPSLMPRFEMPVAPFPSDGFMSSYSSSGSYKANSGFVKGHGATSRNRNHGKGHPHPGDVYPSSSAPEALMDVTFGPLSPQDIREPGKPSFTMPNCVSVTSFSLTDTSLATITSGDLNRLGRDRRSTPRGVRRKKEAENMMKTTHVTEVKVPPPEFDLAASSFPPLPGSVAAAQGGAVTEIRLSDVVRGLKVTTKAPVQDVSLNKTAKDPKESPVNRQDSVTPATKPVSVMDQTAPPSSSAASSVSEEDKAESPAQKGDLASSTQSPSPTPVKHVPPTCSQVVSTETIPPSVPAQEMEKGLKKLSYAEVCQRPARDPPPAQTPSPSPAASSTNQPLQELEVNKVEDSRLKSRQAPEKPRDKEPPRQSSRTFGEAPSRARGSGVKTRGHQRGPNTGKWFPPQRGVRRTGKEQNIPPTSPK